VFGGATTIYAYDGDNVIEELDSSGNPLAQYTQGLGIDEPLALYRSGVASYYHADGLGSITSLTDGSGQLVASYVYDSFGNLTASTGTVTNPFQYTGREFDSETGLYYYRARYYDLTTGRFLSEDSIRFDAGTNLYLYVSNRPTFFLDQFGLSSLIFNPSTGTLTVVNGAGATVANFPAGNNTTSSSRGAWQPGTYEYGYHRTHPDDGPNSAFGSHGVFVFDVRGCKGCGVHSGRADVPDAKGRRGPQHATHGCIRTTDDATELIDELNRHGDPLTGLTVSNSTIPTNVPPIDPSLPGGPSVYLPDGPR
jgi:RHS repeat-associated protein